MSYFTSRLRLAAPFVIGASLVPFVASAQVASTSPTISNVTASTSATTTMPTSTATTSTGTGTTTVIDTSAIQNFITQLNMFSSQINQWIAQLLAALGQTGTVGGGTGTTTPPTTGGAMIDQPSSVRAGTNVDFGGHGFGSEEAVIVTRAGSQVGQGFTNKEGGFTTGSIGVGNTTGTFTYTFVGQTTGKTATVNVTVIP